MTNNNNNKDIKELDEISTRIKNAKKISINNKKNNVKINYHGYNQAVNISIEIITGIILGLILGYFLDNFFKTTPLMLILFFCLGTITGFFNAYKALKRYGYFEDDKKK